MGQDETTGTEWRWQCHTHEVSKGGFGSELGARGGAAMHVRNATGPCRIETARMEPLRDESDRRTVTEAAKDHCNHDICSPDRCFVAERALTATEVIGLGRLCCPAIKAERDELGERVSALTADNIALRREFRDMHDERDVAFENVAWMRIQQAQAAERKLSEAYLNPTREEAIAALRDILEVIGDGQDETFAAACLRTVRYIVRRTLP